MNNEPVPMHHTYTNWKLCKSLWHLPISTPSTQFCKHFPWMNVCVCHCIHLRSCCDGIFPHFHIIFKCKNKRQHQRYEERQRTSERPPDEWMKEKQKCNKIEENVLNAECLVCALFQAEVHLQCPTLTGSRNRWQNNNRNSWKQQAENVHGQFTKCSFILCVPIEVTNSQQTQPKLTICHWIILCKSLSIYRIKIRFNEQSISVLMSTAWCDQTQ